MMEDIAQKYLKVVSHAGNGEILYSAQKSRYLLMPD